MSIETIAMILAAVCGLTIFAIGVMVGRSLERARSGDNIVDSRPRSFDGSARPDRT